MGDDEAVERFFQAEAAALQSLAVADPRLAERFGLTARGEGAHHAVTAALAGGDPNDETLAMEGGSLDLFAFATRRSLLASVARDLAGAPPSPLPRSSEGPLAMPRLERELLLRLVADEQRRLDVEEHLGRASVALVASLAAAWVPPANTDALVTRDRHLARALERMRRSLGETSFSMVERNALEDALDPLEKLVMNGGLPEAAAALAALRVELGNLTPGPTRGMGAQALARLVGSSLGVTMSATELQARLLGARQGLRAILGPRLTVLSAADKVTVLGQAAEWLEMGTTCLPRALRSPLRGALPPPERAPLRGYLCSVASATSSRARLAALVAAHDLLSMGLWTWENHGGPADLQSEAPKVLAEVPPERDARRARALLAAPAAALGSALGVAMLLEQGEAGLVPRAERWLAFGDAPLDVVRAEVFAAPQ